MKKTCLQQDLLIVDMTMQYFIGIKKIQYKVFYLHTSMTFVGQETFKYLVLNISQTNHYIFMHQNEYIEEIKVVDIDKPNH